MDIKTLAIAVVAGAACVLLIASAGGAASGALPLLLLAPMPIYVAAFGWGTNAAIVSAITAVLGSALAVSGNAAVTTAFIFAGPAALIGYQANLAQTDETGKLEWFPLPQLFFNLCMVVAIGFAATLVYFGYEETKASALPLLTEVINQVKEQNPVFDQFTEDDFNQLKESTFNMMPFWVAGIWLIVHCVNLSLAAFVSRASRLMPRPKDDIAGTIRLPMIAVGILFAAIVAAFFMGSGSIQYYSGPFFGVFLTGFSLVGLAVLHLRARTSGGHLFMLMIAYALILFFLLPLFVFAASGLLRTFQRNQIPPARPGGTQT